MSKAALYTYSIFEAKEGSDFIASEKALAGIIKYIEMRCAKNILEVGIGIGTIPAALIEARKNGEIRHSFYYTGIEQNDFCINAFKNNVPGWEKFIRHFKTVSDIPTDSRFDFIIVDGKSEGFAGVAGMLAPRGTIFVEGGRQGQLSQIEGAVTNRNFIKFGVVALNLKNEGNYSIYCFEPGLGDRLHYWKNRIASGLKFRLLSLVRPIARR